MHPIDHLNRYVSNVDVFIAFYTEALGYRLLRKGTKANGQPYAILLGGGHELFISQREGFKAESGGNFRHIGYAVADADSLLADLKARGLAPMGTQIIVKQFSRQFYLRDPDGFEIDLIQWTDKEGFTGNQPT